MHGVLHTLLRDGSLIHFRLAIANQQLGRFALVAEELLGWDGPQVVATLAGLSPMSSEPAHRLAAIGRLPDGDQGPAIEDYRAELGIRLAGHDLLEPTVGEIPDLVEQIIRGQRRDDYDHAAVEERLRLRREEVLTTARAALAGRSDDLARFEEALAAAERTYPVREDNVNLTVMTSWGLLRLA